MKHFLCVSIHLLLIGMIFSQQSQLPIERLKPDLYNIRKPAPPKATGETQRSSFSVNRAFLQSFTVSPRSTMRIKGEKGTKVIFPKQCFVDSTGSVISSDIRIEMLEAYSKADLVLNHLQTVCGEGLLESGGTIYLNAYLNDTAVALQEGTSFEISFPTDDKQWDMSIFYGDTTREEINWISNQAAGDYLRQNVFGGGFSTLFKRAPLRKKMRDYKKIDKYIRQSTRLGWINCDRLIQIQNSEKFDLAVTVSDSSELTVYLVFHAMNSVMSRFCREGQTTFSYVPINKPLTVFGIKQTSDNILYGSKKIRLSENQSVHLNLEPISESELLARMEELD